jgi:hypothetical protein
MDSGNPNMTNEELGDAPQQNSKSAKKSLKTLITEALEIERERRQAFSRRFPNVPQLWPAYPYWDYGTIASAVTKELGSPDKSIKELRWRLKQFQYPYPRSVARKPTTFYQHAKSIGILRDLLKPPLLSDIRSFWWFQRHNSYKRQFINDEKSEYGYPLAFHRELVFQLSAQITAMDKLVKTYGALKTKETQAWFERFEEYRSAALKQLLNEAAIVYPQVQWELIPATQMKEKAEKLKAEISLFAKLNSAIKQRGKGSRKFAHHLTSLICTSRETIIKHQLRPSPETVRVDVKNWIKKHPL